MDTYVNVTLFFSQYSKKVKMVKKMVGEAAHEKREKRFTNKCEKHVTWFVPRRLNTRDLGTERST
ncbi:hypothetical protein AAHB56_28145, partial [Bacillus thuringiensis]